MRFPWPPNWQYFPTTAVLLFTYLSKRSPSMKRQRETAGGSAVGEKDAKKQRKGFSVGPANLPDGVHKRKGMKPKAFGRGESYTDIVV